MPQSVPDRAAKRRARSGQEDDPPIDPAIERLVDLYFENYRQTRDKVSDPWQDENPWYDAWTRVHSLINFEPDAGWPVLLRLIARAPDEEHLGYVAAGPLEDLIQGHGLAFVDRIAEQARRDPRFREALIGVWGWQHVPVQVSAALLPFLPPNWKLHMPGHLGLNKPPEPVRKKR